MRIKILHRRTRKRRQQQQSERAVPASPPSPVSPATPASPATPTSPVAVSTASEDGHSLKRRTSTFGSIERQFSSLNLRTSFSRMRRSRSPPPPYTLMDTPPAAVAIQVSDAQGSGAAATVVAAAIVAPSTAPEDVDAITVIKEPSSSSQDTKTVATIDVKTAPDVAVADTKSGSANKADIKDGIKADLKANQKAEEAAEELLLDVAAAPLEDLPLPSSREAAAFRRLAQPVVVPRLHGGSTVPFARGYAPCLGDTHGIDATTFLAFIDGLNLVTSPHPAALALSAVAFSMQFVPHDYADAVGGVAQLLADVTTTLVAYQRGKLFLARANATLFEPRGLHVSIVKTKRMRAVLGIAPKAPLLAPLSEETVELATLERCMHHLNDNGWAASLELEARTGCLMPMAKPSYRETSADVTASWHPDYAPKTGDDTEDDRPPPPLRRASSTWATVGRSVSHGLAVVAEKRVRFEIKKAEKAASRARRRAWKRHNKGKKLKEPFGEKYRVNGLSWILVRNLDDVKQEEADKEAAKAAKKAAKAAAQARRPRFEMVH